MTHSCGYHCTRPECVIAQRDELRGKLEAKSESYEAYKEVFDAMSEFWRQDVERDTALLRMALEALENGADALRDECNRQHFGSMLADNKEMRVTLSRHIDVILRLRERLEEAEV